MASKLPITVRPLAEAARRISEKTPIGSTLRTAEWERVPLALRERAFFSAGVESARFLSDARQGVLDILTFARESTRGGDALIDRSSLIAKLREVAKREGIPVDPAKAGGLQDITSRPRLALIIDTNLAQAREYARWKAEQDPDLLDAFPAQELIRLEDRTVPRKWAARWVQAGGTLYAGRMIAPKNSPIWSKLSRFGTPWPPFDFNSGMGLEDISRDEAESLGVIAPDEIVPVAEEDFNAGLEASARGVEAPFLSALENLFGNQVKIDDGKISWTSQGDYEQQSNDQREKTRSQFLRSQEALGAVGRGVSDAQDEIGLDEASQRSAAAETAAVAVGRKPLFHEQYTPGTATAVARALRDSLPGDVEVRADGGNVFAWNPAVLARPFEEIAADIRAGRGGEMLGYGADRMGLGDSVTVHILDDAGEVVAGFQAPDATAEVYALARTQDYVDATGAAHSYRIVGRVKP